MNLELRESAGVEQAFVNIVTPDRKATMSIILTAISRQGIIQAADPNLTNNQGGAGTGPKVFAIPYLGAALSLAGSYSVAGARMNGWMEQAIAAYGNSASPTLFGLGENLRARLETEMSSAEKNGGCLIHLCGYVPAATGKHPEFYFICNITGIDPATGARRYPMRRRHKRTIAASSSHCWRASLCGQGNGSKMGGRRRYQPVGIQNCRIRTGAQSSGE